MGNGSDSTAGNDDSCCCYVGNIGDAATEDEIVMFFGSRCGEAPKVAVQRHAKTGQSLGYATVKFTQSSAFNQALSLNASQFRSRPIKIQAKQTKRNEQLATIDNWAAEEEMLEMASKDIDSIAAFREQLNRRFIPVDFHGEFKCCPKCFLPLVDDYLIPGRETYACPKCCTITPFVKNVDERCLLSPCRNCFDLFHPLNMITCRHEKHLFCGRCIQNWLKYCTKQGTSGKCYLPCPKCGDAFLKSDLLAKVQSFDLDAFEQSLIIGKSLKAERFPFIRCPKCDYGWMDEEQNQKNVLRCPLPRCWHVFCRICLSSVKGDTCRNCEKIKLAKQHSFWKMKRDNIKIRKCPNCSTILTKPAGSSNYVICSLCSTDMCYICRESKIDPAEHFCRCFRDVETPDQHSCNKRCLILQDSDSYDAQQLALLENQRRKSITEMAECGSQIDVFT